MKFSTRTLICVLADLFYFVYEKPVPPFCGFYHPKNLFFCLVSLTSAQILPLNSPGELSSRFLQFSFYFKNGQRTFINAKLQRECLFVIDWQIDLSYNSTEENLKVIDLIIPQNIAMVTSRVIQSTRISCPIFAAC